jgi:hypothetical protein
MSLSPRCATCSRYSRVLTGRVGCGSGLPGQAHVRLRSYRSLGRKACEVGSRPDAIHAHPRPRYIDNSRSSRRSSPPILGFPFRLPYVAPPVASVLSRAAASCLWHRLIRTILPVSPPCGLCGQRGRRGWCALATTLAHRLRHATVDGGYRREERMGEKVGSGLRPQTVRRRLVINDLPTECGSLSTGPKPCPECDIRP